MIAFDATLAELEQMLQEKLGILGEYDPLAEAKSEILANLAERLFAGVLWLSVYRVCCVCGSQILHVASRTRLTDHFQVMPTLSQN